ncbi:hypothetical protein AX768_14560 [Burkholderia sp. PAMC 28687]|uniref:Uncharacterized protein n=1 Tax=Caballeronia sordidicola TaxID=196367 RepID=A0A242MUD0_CABSO|nr:hypothetical protein AX768_14560 [Burkholderia sp. PAMC 28687]OTP74922.1 hypothetical protein PAMC26510_15270 [Caballeronia sordidicola]
MRAAWAFGAQKILAANGANYKPKRGPPLLEAAWRLPTHVSHPLNPTIIQAERLICLTLSQ